MGGYQPFSQSDVASSSYQEVKQAEGGDQEKHGGSKERRRKSKKSERKSQKEMTIPDNTSSSPMNRGGPTPSNAGLDNDFSTQIMMEQQRILDNNKQQLMSKSSKRIGEYKTAELDASKSDLRASVISSQVDVSSNHPDFKRRISKDKKMERENKSKTLFGQIGMINSLSQKKMIDSSSKSPSFLTE